MLCRMTQKVSEKTKKEFINDEFYPRQLFSKKKKHSKKCENSCGVQAGGAEKVVL